jgi:hypothetical protein
MNRLRALALIVALVSTPTLAEPLAPHPDRAGYHCPMDADVVSASPGRCPKCGMTLIPLDGFSFDAYRVTLSTTPPVLRAGQHGSLRLSITTPTSGAAVTAYDVIHEQRLHLFIVSADLEAFAHVHPELGADGAWSLPFVFDRPGTYRLIADFLPSGGTPQLVPLTFTTADMAARPIAHPQLANDATAKKRVGTVAVRLVGAETIVAGRATTFTYLITDEASDAPVTDLEPYLGALGHILSVSADLVDVVHAHPLVSAARPNESVSFELLFPRPGRYRVWAQFKRHGQVFTVPYSVEAVPLR